MYIYLINFSCLELHIHYIDSYINFVPDKSLFKKKIILKNKNLFIHNFNVLTKFAVNYFFNAIFSNLQVIC